MSDVALKRVALNSCTCLSVDVCVCGAEPDGDPGPPVMVIDMDVEVTAIAVPVDVYVPRRSCNPSNSARRQYADSPMHVLSSLNANAIVDDIETPPCDAVLV